MPKSSVFLSQPGSPCERAAAQMHDRYDKEGMPSNLVNDSVWKSIGWATPGSSRYQSPRFGELEDALYGSAHLRSKLVSKALSL